MPDDSFSHEPDNCSQSQRLVEQVLAKAGPEWEEVWERLQAVYIDPLVRRVAKRCFAKQAKQDFADQAPGHVFEKLSQFDPQKACFKAWCYTVLKNVAIDMGKAAERRGEVPFSTLEGQAEDASGGTVPFDVAAPSESHLEEFFGRDGMLTSRQIALLEGMPPLRRVIAAAADGCARDVEPATWRRWLEQARVEPPFPPPEIYNVDEPTKRLRLLAEVLGKDYQAVRQHWYRALPVLRKLRDDSEGDDE